MKNGRVAFWVSLRNFSNIWFSEKGGKKKQRGEKENEKQSAIDSFIFLILAGDGYWSYFWAVYMGYYIGCC